MHGGSAFAVYEFAGDGMQVVSVRPGAFEAIETGRERRKWNESTYQA